MRLFSYKMTHDTGFAPNPFFGYLTVATCKPKIRESKKIGDWIVGFSSKSLINGSDPVGEEKVVFAMQVTEKLTIQQYWNDPRFKEKIPDISVKSVVHKCGDNIYKPLKSKPTSINDYRQIKNPNHCNDNKKRDLSGRFVLISSKFWYFGQKRISVPIEIRPKVPYGQASYGVRTHDKNVAERFIEYLSENFHQGVQSKPHTWPNNDKSWGESCG